MKPRTLNNQDGIALGPILFIIAILAIIAAAIAAGSGGFRSNTTTEIQVKSWLKASFNMPILWLVGLISLCRKMVATIPKSISITHSMEATLTRNAPSDHSCDVFDPRGGNIVAAALPAGEATTYSNTYRFVWNMVANANGICVGNCNNPQLMIEVPIDRNIALALMSILGQPGNGIYVGTFNGGANCFAPFIGTYSTGGECSTLISPYSNITGPEGVVCQSDSCAQGTASEFFYYKIVRLR